MSKKEIAIIGGGPSAMIAADILSQLHNVTIYEKEKAIGQKFLVAGKGGFNLTNSLTGNELAAHYSPQGFMQNAILAFDSQSLREWFSDLGIETFIGTSGRVFPIKGIKPAEVLNKIKKKLLSQKVNIKYEHEFVGFDDERNVIINHRGDSGSVLADHYIFSLGGASWSITGSDGKWKKHFENIGINIIPFEASNCGVNIKWNDHIIKNHAGKPLKNISVTVGDTTRKGEAVITNYGLEGNVIYPLIPKIRELLKNKSEAEIVIDFKPDNSSDDLFKKSNNKISPKNYGKTFNLKREQLSLIKSFSTKDEFLSAESFIKKIKSLTIRVESLRDIEEAISTVGGIDLNELNKDFSLKKYPNIYCIGEMVNWDAPTGGFLLQGAFSMGHFCASSLLRSITN
ncbi:NAD(FAD)-utilizing dehydrogenases [hydrothermal vent metagenome]|uniref:NAD(FAD)-utilizing dehydrogenases n=1 Tax=hydrothermal vent metagenome TaxID=652676 RepID=A0A3B1CD26_9ZZZZ